MGTTGVCVEMMEHSMAVEMMESSVDVAVIGSRHVRQTTRTTSQNCSTFLVHAPSPLQRSPRFPTPGLREPPSPRKETACLGVAVHLSTLAVPPHRCPLTHWKG